MHKKQHKLTHNDSTMFTKKAKKAIQANTELILKLQLRKSFSEENISFIHKNKHKTCNLKKKLHQIYGF